eukprot:TRINITY_DN113507_c0_g1_i1.p1 TRINITY_DN113507_c0_g1~~TRINITY_DN113507_c0_g1_i1.p1  ORF type:complete len:227 (-),score=34.74 TRINITY_DN113507_c0_g1_i1:163-819(-)
MSNNPPHRCAHEACDHDHTQTPEIERQSAQSSLYEFIDVTKVRALNESVPDACKTVFKPYQDRLDTTKCVHSDADEELIIHIPFTEVVKLHSICIIGGDDGEAPSAMKAFINREDVVDFEMAQAVKPVQEWELAEDHQQGQVEYPTKYSKFSGVRDLTLFFPANFGADITTIYYIGLKGESTNMKNRNAIVNTVYEATPNLKDHKIEGSTTADIAPAK